MSAGGGLGATGGGTRVCCVFDFFGLPGSAVYVFGIGLHVLGHDPLAFRKYLVGFSTLAKATDSKAVCANFASCRSARPRTRGLI